MSGNLIVAFALFLVSVAVAIGLSLFVITVVLRMQHKHRKRLARVGRRRMSGRLDLEDARLTLLKQKQEKNAIVALTDALAEVHPAARHHAPARQLPPRRARLVGRDLRHHLARRRRPRGRRRACSASASRWRSASSPASSSACSRPTAS